MNRFTQKDFIDGEFGEKLFDYEWKKHDMLKNIKINESKPIVIKIKK